MSSILITEPSKDYELLDSGENEKLERFGKFTLSRPDPQALWHKRLSDSEWKKASGRFNADWFLKDELTKKWSIEFAGLKFYIKPTAFKHVGLFPEQASNWKWLRDCIPLTTPVEAATSVDFVPKSRSRDEGQTKTLRRAEEGVVLADKQTFVTCLPEVLNLFGYTGGATLACAQAGAKVVHVDGSKVAITWARENAELSGLNNKPIRWILDDARDFVRREVKRGRKYHGIIMDPPAFGHGPDGQLWKIEEDFLPLLDDCVKILADKPLFFLINGYSAGYSAIAYENNLLPLVKRFGGKIEKGELAIQETQTARLLPCGIFARWSL